MLKYAFFSQKMVAVLVSIAILGPVAKTLKME
jgi:hypothetical protein